MAVSSDNAMICFLFKQRIAEKIIPTEYPESPRQVALTSTYQETTLKKNELADLIIEELSTKPDITLSVWADANNGEVVSLGYAKVLLSDIAQKNAPFADMEFKCQRTREKIPYQSRVLK